jgi:hypothetical protein
MQFVLHRAVVLRLQVSVDPQTLQNPRRPWSEEWYSVTSSAPFSKRNPALATLA